MLLFLVLGSKMPHVHFNTCLGVGFEVRKHIDCCLAVSSPRVLGVASQCRLVKWTLNLLSVMAQFRQPICIWYSEIAEPSRNGMSYDSMQRFSAIGVSQDLFLIFSNFSMFSIAFLMQVLADCANFHPCLSPHILPGIQVVLCTSNCTYNSSCPNASWGFFQLRSHHEHEHNNIHSMCHNLDSLLWASMQPLVT